MKLKEPTTTHTHPDLDPPFNGAFILSGISANMSAIMDIYKGGPPILLGGIKPQRPHLAWGTTATKVGKQNLRLNARPRREIKDHKHLVKWP